MAFGAMAIDGVYWRISFLMAIHGLMVSLGESLLSEVTWHFEPHLLPLFPRSIVCVWDVMC